MATLDFTALSSPIDFTFTDSYDIATINGTGNDTFGDYLQWQPSSFTPTFRAYSTDLVVDGSNVPTSGTFTFFRLFFGADIATIDNIAVTATDLSYTSGVAANDLFLATVLAGNTTFVGTVNGFGDVRTVTSGTVDGGGDSFSGLNATNRYGDAIEVSGGTLNGGNDVFTGTSQNTHGDAQTLSGGTLVGGNDTIGFTADYSFSRIFQFGDVETVSGGSLTGGNDTIDVSSVVTSTGVNNNVIVGDAFNVFGTASVVGGDDTLIGTDVFDVIYGDISSVNSTSTFVGGDDIIFAGGGNDQVFGDNDELRSGGSPVGGVRKPA